MASAGFIFSNGDQGIEKNHTHIELHKDVGLWQWAQNSLLLE